MSTPPAEILDCPQSNYDTNDDSMASVRPGGKYHCPNFLTDRGEDAWICGCTTPGHPIAVPTTESERTKKRFEQAFPLIQALRVQLRDIERILTPGCQSSDRELLCKLLNVPEDGKYLERLGLLRPLSPRLLTPTYPVVDAEDSNKKRKVDSDA